MKSKLQSLFDKTNIQRTLLNILFLLLVLSLCFQLGQQLLKPYGYDSFVMSEFLINYQAGFVRRGITGELLFFLVKYFNVDFEWTVKIICLIWLIIPCFFFIRGFLKRGYAWYILPTFLFLGSGITHDTWIRKDYLFFCALIPMIWIMGRSKVHNVWKFLIVNILAALTILTHESFAFFSLPLLFLLVFLDHKEKGFWWSVLRGVAFLLPGIIAFVVVSYYKGDLQMAQLIYDSWLPVKQDLKPLELKPNDLDIISLSAIGWDAKWAFLFHIKYNFGAVDRGMSSIFFWPMIFVSAYFIASNFLLTFRRHAGIFTGRDKLNLSTVLLFQLFCLMPMLTILSCDLGRTLFYWIGSSYAVLLWVPAHKIGVLFPRWMFTATERINSSLSNILRPSKTSLTLLLLFLGTRYYRFDPAYVFEKSMVGQVIYILSQPMVLLKNIVLGTL